MSKGLHSCLATSGFLIELGRNRVSDYVAFSFKVSIINLTAKSHQASSLRVAGQVMWSWALALNYSCEPPMQSSGPCSPEKAKSVGVWCWQDPVLVLPPQLPPAESLAKPQVLLLYQPKDHNKCLTSSQGRGWEEETDIH